MEDIIEENVQEVTNKEVEDIFGELQKNEGTYGNKWSDWCGDMTA